MTTTNGMKLTKKGFEILTLALTGKELKFTRAFTGDGSLPQNKKPEDLTALISPKQELAIQQISASKVGTAEIVVEVSNKGLSKGYFIREYGLFARHPDTGQEVLYSYANKGDYCSYLEAPNGLEFINFTLSLMTVIDEAEHITAKITNSNAYVTRSNLEARVNDLFAEGVTPKGFWTFAPDSQDRRLRPLSFDEAKSLLVGNQNLDQLQARIERLEDNLAQVLMTQEVQDITSETSHYIIEDFSNVNQLDLFESKVTSIVAGDDSIDCSPVDGMLPGSWYTISDGIFAELVQVKSISLENDIQRIILCEPVKNNYILEYCRLYRTSAAVSSGSAAGGPPRAVVSWTPNYTWQGQNASASFTAALNSSLANSYAFAASESISFTPDGRITLSEI